MKYRKLGTSDVEVSEISLGCWTLGGQNFHPDNATPIGWADVDEAEAVAAVHYALDRGVTHFDNADVYGNGRAERMLARALGGRLNDVVIATKVGHFKGTADNAYLPLHIRHQCEQSLENLKRDVIDLYYFHHGDFGPSDALLDDAVAEMNRLRDQGKIRLVGLSAYSHDDFTRLVPKVQPTVLQARNNALEPTFIVPGSPTRKLLDERKMSMVCFGPLGQGILLDKFDPDKPPTFAAGDNRNNKAQRFTGDALRALKPRLARLKERFGGTTADLARVALQYLLGCPAVACVIPGFRNIRQVECNLAGADQPLSASDLEFVRETLGN
ncbi:MAG: Aldo-keto reductase IolS [Phycisphaerae bacterium]|nr:Aldo-keto reductase IolS [Phycisphaerae bacterium]